MTAITPAREEPLIELKVYPTYSKTIVRESGRADIRKTFSNDNLNTFIDALLKDVPSLRNTQEAPKSRATILTPYTVCIRDTNDNRDVYEYYPEVRKTIKCYTGRGTSGTLVSFEDFLVPNLVMVHSLTYNKDRDLWAYRGSYVYSTHLKSTEIDWSKITMSTRDSFGVCPAPLPNLFGGGGLCLGSCEVPQTYTSDLRPLSTLNNVIYSAPFNNDLTLDINQGFMSHSSSYSACDVLRKLDAFVKKHNVFPYDKILRGYKGPEMTKGLA